jgi:cytochrome c oxidase assembly protein subunit 15
MFYTSVFHPEFFLMPAAAVSIDSKRLPSPALRGFAWGVLVYFIIVFLGGTLVRAPGAGAGCGLLAWTCAGTIRGHLARAAAVAAVAFTVIEAILGALLVKLGLTAQSKSPIRPAYLSLHLTNTLLLLAALTLTAHLLSRRKGYLRGSLRLVAPFGAVVAVFVVMIVGVTGSLAALGDTLFPASSLGSALAQDFSSTSGWLVRWRWMHPTVAILAGLFLIWLLRRAARNKAHWDNRRLSALIVLLLAVVYTLGVLDVVFLAPLWIQVAHLLAADTLWASLVVLTARLTLQPRNAS